MNQTVTPECLGWTLSEWQSAYEDGASPRDLLIPLWRYLNPEDPAWISLIDGPALESALESLAELHTGTGKKPDRLPLFGVPFAVKDNIDVAGMETTAGCPAFAYTANRDAEVVRLLKAAGAVLLGKTNLDQFATGLVGTRSPYGIVPNCFNEAYVAGGSSSGSASVVARGLVPFALGTDTAGSGRVPAGFNNLVGLKPTRGAFSTQGLVPACRSLDCISIFSLDLATSATVLALLQQPDPEDPYSRAEPAEPETAATALRHPGPIQRLAVPAAPDWRSDPQAAGAWERTLERWQSLGFQLEPRDFTPLLELAALLYQGPWIAERYTAVGDFLEKHPEAVHPVVRDIIRQGSAFSAEDLFNSEYRRATLLKRINQQFGDVDALLVPTASRLPRIDEVQAEPVALNSELGTYTNFVNLADLCALALPAGFREDGLPFGVTLISGAWKDRDLLHLGATWLNRFPCTLGATGRLRPTEPPPAPPPQRVALAVVGAHLSGMPLNHQLSERGGRLLEASTTAPHYRLFALPGTTPPKPGLQRVGEDGAAIALELWELTLPAFGRFVREVPPPLGIGNVELADGRWVKGFICEGHAIEGAEDVTRFGGWRNYMEANNPGAKDHD